MRRRLDENFRAWLVSRSLTPQQAQYLCLLKNRGIATRAASRSRISSSRRSPFSNAAGIGVELFGEDGPAARSSTDLNESVFTQPAAS